MRFKTKTVFLVFSIPACFQKPEAGDQSFVTQFTEAFLSIQGTRKVIYWLRNFQLLSWEQTALFLSSPSAVTICYKVYSTLLALSWCLPYHSQMGVQRINFLCCGYLLIHGRKAGVVKHQVQCKARDYLWDIFYHCWRLQSGWDSLLPWSESVQKMAQVSFGIINDSSKTFISVSWCPAVL